MKELTLDEVQKLELEILKATDRFCRENDIKLYLAYGTLLGAVRHGGFIPWDDDVDVFLLRSDYEKLIRLLEGKLIEDRYRLTGFETDGYDYPFYKVEDIYTECEEQGHAQKICVYIDIFPLDYVKNLKSVIQLTKKIGFQKELLTASYACYSRPKSLLRHMAKRIMRPFCRIIGTKRICKRIDKIAKACSDKNRNSSMLANLVWEDNKVILHDLHDYLNAQEILFCGQKFFVPANYTQLLECTYGNYLQLPPEDERVGHQLKAYLLQGDI